MSKPGSPEYRRRQREYMRNLPREKIEIANKKRRERRKGKDGDRVRALQMKNYYLRRDKILEKNKQHWRLNAPRLRAEARERKYGISADDYARMLKAQNGCCAICDEKRRLGVDHNHTTGAVRALLCSPCNTALGLFKENVERISAAVDYLESHRLTETINARHAVEASKAPQMMQGAPQ